MIAAKTKGLSLWLVGGASVRIGQIDSSSQGRDLIQMPGSPTGCNLRRFVWP
jgi:hypothetical protein